MQEWRILANIYDEFFFNYLKKFIDIHEMRFTQPTEKQIKMIKNLVGDCENLNSTVIQDKDKGEFEFYVSYQGSCGEIYGNFFVRCDKQTNSIIEVKWKYPSVILEVYDYLKNLEEKVIENKEI